MRSTGKHSVGMRLDSRSIRYSRFACLVTRPGGDRLTSSRSLRTCDRRLPHPRRPLCCTTSSAPPRSKTRVCSTFTTTCRTSRRLLAVRPSLSSTMLALTTPSTSSVSSATTMQTVQALVAGAKQVEQELDAVRESRLLGPDDRFVQVMEVRSVSTCDAGQADLPFPSAICPSRQACDEGASGARRDHR